MKTEREVHLKVRRQESPDDLSSWEEFRVTVPPSQTVMELLQRLKLKPITADGLPTTPVVFDASCTSAMCGACAMLINGRVRMACTTLVDMIKEPIILEPLRSFPVVRDLMVDRDAMFEALKNMRLWTEIDGWSDAGSGPRKTPAQQEWSAMLSRCTMCGCCCEASPQYHARSPFVGPHVMAHVARCNREPNGVIDKTKRLTALMQPGGLADSDEGCSDVCPQKIPLDRVTAGLNWEVTAFSVRRFFHG
ncbi:MAG: succinate dehydrogenase iron-sulfur subunit [Deltaproteobacteria bacterium]|nr:succinate dehydrogenase iron-sulfur subunit [Deltaproteobacteria bacterium]